MTQKITAKLFLKYTGRPPENDDLERCNCTKKGFGHSFCGWNSVLNLPRFEVGDLTELPPGAAAPITNGVD